MAYDKDKNEGYNPKTVDRGYQPSQIEEGYQPSPTDYNPQGGYQPEVGTGDNPSNEPTPPEDE